MYMISDKNYISKISIYRSNAFASVIITKIYKIPSFAD